MKNYPSLEHVLGILGFGTSSRRRFKVLCPIHSDVVPSLSCDLEKDVWYCHGCGKGGDPVELYAFAKKIGRKQAMKELGVETHETMREYEFYFSVERQQKAFEIAKEFRSVEYHAILECSSVGALLPGDSRPDKAHEGPAVVFRSQINGKTVGLQFYYGAKRYVTFGKRAVFVASRPDYGESLYVVDGCFDALALASAVAACATFGVNAKREQIDYLVSMTNRFVLCPDNTTSEKITMLLLGIELLRKGCSVEIACGAGLGEAKDIDEYLAKNDDFSPLERRKTVIEILAKMNNQGLILHYLSGKKTVDGIYAVDIVAELLDLPKGLFNGAKKEDRN
ncbi:MAG: CHC2 zinc finger domain-containing protein [Nitrososphaerota archaeon]